MSNMLYSDWYGSNGMSKAYNFFSKVSYGNKAVEQEQKKQGIKAQRLIDWRAKKCPSTSTKTAAEDDAIAHFYLDLEGTIQKYGRVSSPKGDSSRKRSKHDTSSSSYKGKAKILVPNSDDDSMDDDETIMDGEGNKNMDCSVTPPQSPWYCYQLFLLLNNLPPFCSILDVHHDLLYYLTVVEHALTYVGNIRSCDLCRKFTGLAWFIRSGDLCKISSSHAYFTRLVDFIRSGGLV